MNPKLAKAIRIIALIFLGLTSMMNLLGGAGTVCAAFLTEKFESMAALLDYNWLYQILMIATIATGVANIWALVQLAKRQPKSYQRAVIILVIGTVLGAIQVFTSLQLRGKAVPANMKLYINLLTLVLFLILGAPGLRLKVGWDKNPDSDEGAIAGGTAAILAGILALTVFLWAGPSHTYMGTNWVYQFEGLLVSSGVLLLIGGISLIGKAITQHLRFRKEETGKAS